jgi:serine/threonine-protein kinase
VPEAAAMVGQVVLQKYKIIRLLDEGGMSSIYLARQLAPDREAVVKVLKDALQNHPRAQEHFRREIHILSRFSHPHAVAYYDSAPNDPGGPILVMEYLRGVDLNILLQRQRRLTPERAGRLLAQLCDVLQAAHDAGIIHRDLKPGNLMILYPGTPQETLKLMDFGLARMKSLLYLSPEEIVDWRLPNAAGTPEYICPEQVRGNEMDARGDLYSVGVILFEMLTGKRPFAGSDVDDLLNSHVDVPPPTFAELGLANLVPHAAEEVVRRCLAKHPDQRPQTAGEVIAAFEQALGKRFTVARRPAAQTPLSRASKLAAAPPAPERNAFTHSVEATMPEAMAMIKLKGFICDLGGNIVESVPGMIHVRLPEARAESKKSAGLLGWMDRGRQHAVLAPATATDLELHMERRDPGQPNKLTVTLVMRPSGGLITAEWRTRCQQIGRDLGAYLMGR